MSRFMRKAAAVVIALALSVSPVFATAGIVSPVANTVVESDSLLVSVKVTGAETVNITVYREYYESSPAVYDYEEIPDGSGDALDDLSSGDSAIVTGPALTSVPAIEENSAAGSEAAGAAEKEAPAGGQQSSGNENSPSSEGGSAESGSQSASGESAQTEDEGPEFIRVLVKEAEYSPVSSDGLTAEDLQKIAAGARYDEDGEPILLSDGGEIPEYVDRVYASTVKYTNESEIGFYTKQLSSVAPGLYKVVVRGENGTTSCFVAVREKQAEPDKSNIFNDQRSGALQFLRNMLKALFR